MTEQQLRVNDLRECLLAYIRKQTLSDDIIIRLGHALSCAVNSDKFDDMVDEFEELVKG